MSHNDIHLSIRVPASLVKALIEKAKVKRVSSAVREALEFYANSIPLKQEVTFDSLPSKPTKFGNEEWVHRHCWEWPKPHEHRICCDCNERRA